MIGNSATLLCAVCVMCAHLSSAELSSTNGGNVQRQAVSWCPVSQPVILLDVDFTIDDLGLDQAGIRMLASNIPSTSIRSLPHRGVRALVRDLSVQPEMRDGVLNIAANEVGQGLHRVFDGGVPLCVDHQVLVMRLRVFSDAALTGTNSIAVRLWAQSGFGPNNHRERMELSAHFNAHPRGSRQVYPNAYRVRDGWETWAMPEGTNDRRAGIYYRLAAEGRRHEIRGVDSVRRGYYWTWQGLDWPKGWAAPLGGGLYDPSALPLALNHSYTIKAVFRRDVRQSVTGLPCSFATVVDIVAPQGEGRVKLDASIPDRIHEVRLILRSELLGQKQDWAAMATLPEGQSPYLGVEQASVQLLSRADATLDGVVDEQDWQVLRAHFGRSEGVLHYHGDALGDGQVGLNDIYYIVLQDFRWLNPRRYAPSG